MLRRKENAQYRRSRLALYHTCAPCITGRCALPSKRKKSQIVHQITHIQAQARAILIKWHASKFVNVIFPSSLFYRPRLLDLSLVSTLPLFLCSPVIGVVKVVRASPFVDIVLFYDIIKRNIEKEM